MSTSLNEPAAAPAKGIFASAKQNFGDLFRWRQRVSVTNSFGETYTEWQYPTPLENPISLLAQLSIKGWVFFIVGLLAWLADAFDFHAISIQTVKFSEYFNTSKTNITTAITLTLLLRSVGAAIFGLAGDRFGRKWPMVGNLIILGCLQIATIYSKNFQQFLAVRSLFGLFMGGVYGNAIAMALENCPVNARGLMSGILQQGYSMGYVIAACANLGVGGASDSWKTVFWIGAGLSLGVGVIRMLLPESNQFIEAKKIGKKGITAHAFWVQTRKMIRLEWRMVIYCCILMSWFTYISHVTQDSYTTFLLTSKGLDNAASSRASILMQAGACFGTMTMGYISQFVGRRRSMVVAALISGALIPAWILPTTERGLSAAGFFLQFFVQGSWGAVPIHLNELSPPAFRSVFPGLTYQIGNLVSSPSTEIVSAISASINVSGPGGKPVPAYGPTMGVATAIIILGIVFTTAVGPEKRGRHFELEAAAGATIEDAKALEDGLTPADSDAGSSKEKRRGIEDEN
ncbi:hypothetical protein B7494_g4590 [Chlorociboria aeruginascens]|nr:hypothetical protein B7494_g4590 [Chlorociboria aeruginascens]